MPQLFLLTSCPLACYLVHNQLQGTARETLVTTNSLSASVLRLFLVTSALSRWLVPALWGHLADAYWCTELKEPSLVQSFPLYTDTKITLQVSKMIHYWQTWYLSSVHNNRRKGDFCSRKTKLYPILQKHKNLREQFVSSKATTRWTKVNPAFWGTGGLLHQGHSCCSCFSYLHLMPCCAVAPPP
jgi:hypothetical protein